MFVILVNLDIPFLGVAAQSTRILNLYTVADRFSSILTGQPMAQTKKLLTQIKRKITQAGKKPQEVVQLDLAEMQIGKLTPDMQKAIEGCKNLEVLSLAECDLTSLENFPQLGNLVQLDVSSNSLTDNDVKVIAKNCKKLTSLSIGDNGITCLKSIQHLKALKELQTLHCDDTPVSNESNYTKTAFESLKNLKILDGKDKQGKQMAYNGEGENELDEQSDDQDQEQQEFENEGSESQSEDEDFEQDQDAMDEQQPSDDQEEVEDTKPKKQRKK